MIYLPTLSPLARHALASIILMTMETRLVRQDRLKVTDALADVEPILNEIMPKATTVHPVGIPIADLNTMFGLNKEQTNGS